METRAFVNDQFNKTWCSPWSGPCQPVMGGRVEVEEWDRGAQSHTPQREESQRQGGIQELVQETLQEEVRIILVWTSSQVLETRV